MGTAGAPDPHPRVDLERLLEDDPTDLYENAPMGYLSTLPDGRLVKMNRTFSSWTGRSAEELLGSRFQDLLTVGGRVFWETHLLPLLRMQGAVREIALDVLGRDGTAVPCLLNAVEVRDGDGRPLLVRATLFDATDRRRYERELLAAQRAAEQSEARARTVQTVVWDLATATSAGDVGAVVVEHGRAALSARGGALLVVADRADAAAPPRLRTVHADGLPDALLDELYEAAGERLSAELARGVRTVACDDRLRAARPRLAAELAVEGMADLVLVPVTADNRRLGVLVLGRGQQTGTGLISLSEPGDHVDLPVPEVDLLWTLGRQAGQALERVRMHDESARQAERSAVLLEAARLLAEAADVNETVERVAELAVRRLSDVCVVDLASEHGLTRPAVQHRDPARRELVEQLRDHLPHRLAPHPTVRALREGRTQWVREVDDELLRAITVDHAHLAAARSLELAALLAVPLTAEGRRLGVITFGVDRRSGPFTTADVEVAEQLALQLALVVAKAQRSEADARTSHTLQASLLPPAPAPVAGLALAARYLTATREVEVGGDFHDLVRLPDGRVALTVGDVVGHDITAAATMGQLTSVYRALLADLPTPSAVIDRLQASWSLLGLQRMATALFATLDPASGQLRVASAGHLPPLLLAEGRAEYLPVRPSRMLGAPPAPAEEWAGVLPRGATLVLFTDGLVESRTADIDEGLRALAEAARRAADAGPDALCDRLLEVLTGPHRADDIALLVLTRS